MDFEEKAASVMRLLYVVDCAFMQLMLHTYIHTKIRSEDWVEFSLK
jgi:hypothetical protein